MKQFAYTKTALASLLTLYSFSNFAMDLSNEVETKSYEIRKQEGNKVMEVIETSNKKLREKMDRICNFGLERELKKELEKEVEGFNNKEEKLEKKFKENERENIVSKEQEKIIEDLKLETLNTENSNTANLESSKLLNKNGKKEIQDDIAIAVNDDNLEEESKEIISSSNSHYSIVSTIPQLNRADIVNADKVPSSLKITFGGIVDTQSYSTIGLNNKDYNQYYVNQEESSNDYQIYNHNRRISDALQEERSNDGSINMVADAILHLRAENRNEDLGFLYGADVQFHVPVTDGKSASQGINATESRSAHVFLNSKYGELKLGYQFSHESLMRINATSIATIDGATDSDWFRKVNLKGQDETFPFYVTPRLYTESFSSESERLSFLMAKKYNKGIMTTLPFRISYYSPDYMGTRFGISYSPRYERVLFNVNDNISINPFKAEVDNITNAFVEASRLKFDSNAEIEGKKYKSPYDAIEDFISKAKFADINSATQIEKTAVLNETVKILPAIYEGKAPTNYSKYGIMDFPDSIVTMTKPVSDTAMKAKLINIEPTLSLAGGNKDQFVKKLKGAVSKLFDDGPSFEEVRAAVEKQFLNTVINRVLYEKGIKDSDVIFGRNIGPNYEHIVSAGASYEYDFNKHNIKLKTSIVGECGKAKSNGSGSAHLYDVIEYSDLFGINFGVKADYQVDEDQDIKLAASFAYLGKSGQPKIVKKELEFFSYEKTQREDEKGLEKLEEEDTTYWTAGAGYQYRSFYTSLAYFGSSVNYGNRLHDIVLGLQYDLSSTYSKSKFVPYAALHYFIAKKEDIVPSNKGFLLLTGVKFSF